MTDKKDYYTAGELAKLFGIPKQTMFYYDKMGLLTPEFVAENGYRYYAMPQYLTLEIILFLRKLDISVPHIKEFLEHRSHVYDADPEGASRRLRCHRDPCKTCA